MFLRSSERSHNAAIGSHPHSIDPEGRPTETRLWGVLTGRRSIVQRPEAMWHRCRHQATPRDGRATTAHRRP